mmetsp:Transcript_9406/g.23159  ORF Transcript_9406/g.23159 Transcript_9406/m.23159 type:complete len:320 (-) Transcript_9406:476-1435(-)
MHGGVHISAVVHIHRLAAATLLHHAPERLLDVGDGGRRRRVFAVEEVDVEVMAALLEVVQSEGTAAVEAQVLGIVGGGNTVGAEPVASRKRLQRRGQAVHVIPLVATVAEDQLFLMARPSAVETRLIYRHQGLLLQLLRHLLQTHLQLEALGRGLRDVAQLEERLEQVLLLDGSLLLRRRCLVPGGSGLAFLALPCVSVSALPLLLARRRLLGLARGRQGFLEALVRLEGQQPLLVQLAEREGGRGDGGGGVKHSRDVPPLLAATSGVEPTPTRDVVIQRLQIEFLSSKHRPPRHALALALHEVSIFGAEVTVLALLQT